jgi:peptide/nickel transport system substrate-binding protein
MTRFDMKPFTDSRVRLAAKLSINRPVVTNTTYFGFADIGDDQFGKNGPSLYYNSSLPQRKYDPEKAKFLLKQAGYPDGINVTLVLAPDSGSQGPEGVVLTAAQVWQQQAKAAGINFQIQQITNLNQFKILSYPFSATWWSPGVPFVYNWFTSTSSYNEGWHHPSWDKLYYRAIGEIDPQKAKGLWDEMQAQFYAESGHIIWGHYNLIDGLSPKIRGAYQNQWPLSSYDFKSYSFA